MRRRHLLSLLVINNQEGQYEFIKNAISKMISMLRAKSTISFYFLCAILVLLIVLISYAIIYSVWDGYYKYLLRNNGKQVVATIIRKDNGRAQYDIEYPKCSPWLLSTGTHQ